MEYAAAALLARLAYDDTSWLYRDLEGWGPGAPPHRPPRRIPARRRYRARLGLRPAPTGW